MKKFLAIVLGSLFMLGFAVAAYAVHAEIPAETQAVVAKGATQVSIGGNIRVRGEMRDNIDDLNDDAGSNTSWYDQRVRLGVDATMENAKGYISIEGASGTTSDTYTWGEDTSGATGGYTEGNAKRGGFTILESWLQYKGDVVSLKVGHMPLSLGNKLFFDHTKFGDDAIVVFADPTKEVHVGLLTAKFDEGNTNESRDDSDVYVGLATLKSEAFSGGADITYLRDGDVASTGTVLKFYNIGLRGEISAGPIKLKANAEIQTGEANRERVTTDYEGNAIMLSASMKADPVTLGLEFGRGTGDDTATTENEGFVTSLSSGTPYVGFVYGPRLKTAANTTNSGIANTTYVKATADAKVGSVGVNAALIWLQATEEVAIMDTTQPKDSDLGIEIDAKLTYSLAKNLNYWIESGYFMPGDAYKLAGGKDPSDAYAVRHGLELSF